MEAPAEVTEVVDGLVRTLGDDLTAVLWQGSWARDEATAESDHDLVIVVRNVDDDVLNRMRDVFAGRESWSSFVKSEAEIATYTLAGRSQFHFGLQVLYGQVDPPPLTLESMLEEVRSLVAWVNHETRYRILHGAARSYAGLQPDYVRERNVRWMYHLAKGIVLALKAREYVLRGAYPVTRAELRERVTDPLEAEIIDTVDRWPEVKGSYADDITDIALKLDAVARGLTLWLAEQGA